MKNVQLWGSYANERPRKICTGMGFRLMPHYYSSLFIFPFISLLIIGLPSTTSEHTNRSIGLIFFGGAHYNWATYTAIHRIPKGPPVHDLSAGRASTLRTELVFGTVETNAMHVNANLAITQLHTKAAASGNPAYSPTLNQNKFLSSFVLFDQFQSTSRLAIYDQECSSLCSIFK